MISSTFQAFSMLPSTLEGALEACRDVCAAPVILGRDENSSQTHPHTRLCYYWMESVYLNEVKADGFLKFSTESKEFKCQLENFWRKNNLFINIAFSIYNLP